MRLANESNAPLTLRYSMELRDGRGVQVLASETSEPVQVQPGEEDRQQLALSVPSDIAPGAYYLLIGTDIPIRVGRGADPLRVTLPLMVTPSAP